MNEKNWIKLFKRQTSLFADFILSAQSKKTQNKFDPKYFR